MYAPGATLDPACAPTDPNCGVVSNVATGTAGQVPYYAADGNILAATSTFTILSNGNVGIGTTNPGSPLTVVGQNYEELQFYKSGSTQLGHIGSTGNGILRWSSNLSYDGANFNLDDTAGNGVTFLTNSLVGATTIFALQYASAGTNPRTLSTPLVVTSAGNVGIGTTNPIALLDLAGPQNTSAIPAPSTPTVSATLGDGGSCDVGTHKWKVTFVNFVGETTPSVASAVATCTAASSTVPVTISKGPTGTTARNIYRTVAGNTGNYKLVTTINDNTTTSYNDNNSDASLGAAAPSSNTTAVALFQVSGTTRMVINNNGNVGIGTTTPGSNLSVVSGISVGANYGVLAPANGMIIQGNVGIGNITPGVKLEVGDNTASAAQTTLRIVGGTAADKAPMLVLQRYAMAVWNISAGGPSASDFVIGLNSAGTTDANLAAAAKLTILNNGNVGIGTTTPFANLSVATPNGASGSQRTLFAIGSSTTAGATTTLFSVANTGDVTINGSSGSTCTIGNSTGATMCSSDERLKANITTIPNALHDIEQIKGITFNWADTTKNQSQFIGVIAQDVQKVFPQAVAMLGNGYLAVDYGALVAPLIEAVKEIGTISGEFKSNLVAWLGNTTNGIVDLFATTVHTQNLCVRKSDGSNVCITGDELNTILNQSGQGAIIITDVPAPTSPQASQGTAPATFATSTATTTDSTATSTDSTATTTPPIADEGLRSASTTDASNQ